ncbi:MAG: glycoside hydrolase family 10 protein [Verrucomicrobium sp.]|nr:family 10 glycosylhydrolase [Verrucomicrobium sp.]
MPPSAFSRFRLLLSGALPALAVWFSAAPLSAQVPPPPQPLREFRGAWVATVRGIDFPFEPGDPTAKQQAELVGIVNKASQLKLNALIFQVRPAGDAVYKSDIEPWSPWLTNQMGKAPDPMWDPLAFFIKEAHDRGIELHAWFNPFRALSGPKYSGAGKHVTVTHPTWCMKYGEDTWMDPGEPQVRERSLAVMMDVLRRYDVDGIHMDDYFYPYPLKNPGGSGYMPFPDDRTFNTYVKGGGKMSKSDWRRDNVNSFIEGLYNSVKREKPWVRVGISPFGIWRPNYPAGYAKGALDPYEALSADSLKWLQSGWVDYFTPQLYWPNEPKNLSFSALFDWWLSQNTARRHIWPGMASDRVLQDRQPHEILKQIGITRTRAAYMPPGHLHWNYSALGKNKGTLADLCAQRAYQEFAIPPSAPWLGLDKPTRPFLQVSGTQVTWELGDARLDNMVKWWLIQTYENSTWVGKKLVPVEVKSYTLPPGAKGIAVRAISRSGVAGDAAVR